MLVLPFVALLSASAPARQATAVQPTALELVEQAREAIGWSAVASHVGSVRVSGDAFLMDTDATQLEVFDGRGSWLQRIDGPLPSRTGFDGGTLWHVGWNGILGVQVLGDRAEAELMHALFVGAWCGPGSPLRFGKVASTEDDAWSLPFKIEGEYVSGALILDQGTALPRSATFGKGKDKQEWLFDAFSNPVEGYRFPARASLIQSGQEHSFKLTSIKFVDAVDSAHYTTNQAFDGLDRPRITFNHEVEPQLQVKAAPTGHLLVKPSVNGEDFGWFIFDTGAGTNCISTSVAGRLSEPFGRVVARGVGGTVPTHFRRAGELRLGPVAIENPILMELDLAFLDAAFGVPIGGVIGYELLGVCTVELDFEAASIALYDPSTYELPGSGAWEAALIYRRNPAVRGQFEGRAGIFNLDTGAAGDTVAMHYRTVTDLALLSERETTLGRAGGVGGDVRVRRGTATRFTLGGHEFRDLGVLFAIEDKGAFADPYLWGNIGGQLLEPFVMVFDYPRRRVGFVPRPD